MRKTSCHKILKILFVLLGVLLTLFLGVLLLKDNGVVENKREVAYVVQEILGKQIQKEDSPIGIVVEFTIPIADEPEHGQEIMFYASHHWVDVWVGEEPVYTFRPSGELSFIKTLGSKWVCIPLVLGDEGKDVRIILTPVYGNNVKNELEIFQGSSMEIYRSQLSKMLPAIMLCIANILIGIMLLFAELYYRKKARGTTGLFSLGMMGISFGFWQLAHNDYSPWLWEGKEIFLYYLSVTMMLIYMIPLVYSSMRNILKNRIIQYYLIGMAVMAVIQIVLQVAGIRDLREMFVFTHGGIILGALLVIGTTIIGFVKTRKRNEEKSYAWILGIGLLGDLVLYYMNASSSGLVMILTAILIYMILEAFRFMSAYFEQKKLLEEKEQQLTNSRMMVLMSQIRSHFVFNILNAISGMCKYDPEKADETIVRFSRYLRNNIDIMQEDKMLPFEMELQRLEDYILLEQVRFGDRLEFVTDLEVTDFMIPPLILQPLVENSIKHGISKKKGGGTILLSTWKEDRNIMISIDDDGVGFDMKELEKETSVGLRNIRFRIQQLLQGTLTFKSEINEGTKAIISFLGKEE